jgi:hypothetical protein
MFLQLLYVSEVGGRMGDNASTVGGALGWCYWDYPIVPIGLYHALARLIGAYPLCATAATGAARPGGA